MSGTGGWWSLKEAPLPTVAVEIAGDHVSAASLESRGGRAVVGTHAEEPIEDGAVVASLTAANIRDKAAVAGALRRVLEAVGRPRRIGLVIPDPAAKVSLIRFEHVPPAARDLDQLIRWQVRKAAPFPIEEAQVSYIRGLSASDGQEFVVSLARRDIVQEYEAICESCGAQAGVVDLSTFNVINAVLAAGGPGADWLLVNVAAQYASIAILRGEDLMFFRSRGSESEGTLADLVHQTAMYYEDRLQGAGFSRVMLSGASAQTADAEDIRRNLQERLGRPVETVNAAAAAAFTDRIAASHAFLDTLAPLVGLLVRGRETARA
jgi:Tfp pilus assembly PilM family ATPase